MKTTRKSDSQIMRILSQAGSGVPASELCRECGMSSATFYLALRQKRSMQILSIARPLPSMDSNTQFFKALRVHFTGVLTALISVKYLWMRILLQDFIKHSNDKLGIHGI